MMLRRAAIDEVGKFDETLSGWVMKQSGCNDCADQEER
jgi:hypothetical protein